MDYATVFFAPQGDWQSEEEAITSLKFRCTFGSFVSRRNKDVENYPLFVGSSPEDCYDYDEVLPHEWMSMGRGQILELSSSSSSSPASGRARRVPPSWDAFTINFKGENESADNYWIPYPYTLKQHYKQLVEFERDIELLRYTPLTDLATLEPTKSSSCADDVSRGEDDDDDDDDGGSTTSILQIKKIQRMNVYKSSLEALFSRGCLLQDKYLISLIAEFSTPPLPQFRLHFDEEREL